MGPPSGSLEPLARRIAAHRARLGVTQERLAQRVALSRAAVSHIEAGLSVPSERTVTLLAGTFKIEPHELVGGTDYPPAKADRLPPTTARYTEIDMALAMLDNDLAWSGRFDDDTRAVTVSTWRAQLSQLLRASSDPDERRRIDAARRNLP